MGTMTCERCRGSGEIARRNHYPLNYAGPGPVPDWARGVYADKCDVCGGTGAIEDEEPCPVCGCEERGQGGYLSCECPAPKGEADVAT